jgi:glutathione synthase/RimK-type ligase-like ATP-grasp enzyme
MILILTHTSDLGADLVIRHLVRRDHLFRRINTERLGTPQRHVAFRQGQFVLLEGESQIEASSVRAVWARRFADPSVLDTVDVQYRGFAERELTYALDGFIAAVSGIQVNPIDADRTSGNRLVQAIRAAKAGFLVPDTLVTQDASRAHEFIVKHPKVVTKALSFGLLDGAGSRQAYTALVGPKFDMSGLAACPALFQEFVPKHCEWRVTTVGTRAFAARTRRDAVVDTADWRQSPDPGGLFEVAALPPEVQRMVMSLCACSGLVFGTHDLIETPSGDFYFLETNPAGQWGWLEVRLGLPVGEAIASLLAA